MSQEKQASPVPVTRPNDLHPNSEPFWMSRGYPDTPSEWETRDRAPLHPKPEPISPKT